MIRAQPLLGTLVEIKIHDSITLDDAHDAINAAFACIEKVQQLMSFHDPDSELSLLNRHAYFQRITVHPFTYAVLKRANYLHHVSLGLFDCSIANTLVDWQILPSPMPHPMQHKPHFSQADVKLFDNYSVQFTAPILIDLGGIAKGFAVDLAIHVLRNKGIKNAVVNAGGDLRVLGQTIENIMIRDPQQPQHFYNIGDLSNGAIASSACYFSKTKFNHQRVNALINPHTRQALDSAQSFSVIAPNACIADALTKVVALSQNPQHPCLGLFAAQAFIL